MHTEGHDMGKPEAVPAHPTPKLDAEHPGYETQDVNVGGIVVFLAGLAGSVVVFFLFCFVMGKALDSWLLHSDKTTATQWQADLSEPGATPHGQKRDEVECRDGAGPAWRRGECVPDAAAANGRRQPGHS
jgi:hypothetical protein